MIDHVPDKKVVVASYTPDQAGRPIGWVATKLKENVGQLRDIDIVEVNVGVAHISKDGARRGYTERTEGGETREITFPKDVTGFVATSSLHLAIIRGMSVQEAAVMGPIDLGGATNEREASQTVAHTAGLEGVTWADNSQQLLAELKKRLGDEGVSDYYGLSYYALNTAIGHAGVRSCFRNFVLTDDKPSFVADPEMQATTAAQLEASEAIVADLSTIKANDRRMRDNLTVYSEVPANKIADVFMGSRYAVHTAEARAIAKATSLVIPRYSFLPAGFRPSGRPWSYMDATLGFEDKKAFGVELAALRKQNIGPADSELEREINETVLRLAYAQAAVKMLHGLLAAEKAAK